MEIATQSIDSITKRMKFLSKRIEKDKLEFNNLTSTLREVCPHEKGTIKSRYVEGGYLNTAYTDYTEICDYCGKFLKEWSEDHGTFA